nr:unnamed protein product [Callosobruchus chinensis]
MEDRWRPASRTMKMVQLAKKSTSETHSSRDLDSSATQNLSMDRSSTSPGYILTSPGNLINTTNNASLDTNTMEAVPDTGFDTGLNKSSISSSNTSRIVEENDISAFCLMSDDQILEIVDENLQLLREKEGINHWDMSEERTSDDEEDDRKLEENDEEGRRMGGVESVSDRELTKLSVRTRSKIRNSSTTWEQKLNQKRRETGVSYKGKKKQTEGWIYDRPRPGRFLADACHCRRANKERSKLKCSLISEERRRKIFNLFWNKMTWPEKKVFVKGLVKVEKVKRRRGNNERSRRNFSMTYRLKNGLDDVLVCKNMFVGTLGLKGRTVVEWVKEDLENIENTEIVEGPEINRRSLARQVKNESSNTGLKTFFDKLAKMESHYCRASSKKIYLEPLWMSKLSLYRFYESDYCIQNKLPPVSIAKFHATFNDLNLSLFHPKKDECDVCVGYRTSNVTEEKIIQAPPNIERRSTRRKV